MAENENIGGIEIQIVGDYSTLQADIDKATQVAAEGGREIAEALSEGAAGADALTGALASAATAGESFEAQVQALIDSGATLSEALEQVDASLLPIEADADKSAEAIGDMGTASKEAAPAVENVSKSTNSLVDQLGALAAKAGVVAILYELGQAAIEAADTVGDAAIAMGLLSGNAEEAATTVEALRDVADDAALGMPELLTAATRMTAFMGSSKDVPDILRAVADSAAVMHVSVAASAGGFERIIASGDLSQRSLQRLGLTMDDVASVMGLSGAKMKTAFENLDQSTRMEVMIAAMGKFKGAAELMSDDVGGSLQRLKNRFFEALEAIGSVIEPVVNGIFKLTTALMNSLDQQALSVRASIKVAVEGAKALFAAMNFDFTSASTHFNAMTTAWAKGTTDLEALLKKQTEVNKTTAEGTRLTGDEIKARSLVASTIGETVKALREHNEASKPFTDFTREFPTLAQAAAAATEALNLKVQAEAKALSETEGWLVRVLARYNEHKATLKDVEQAVAMFEAAQKKANATLDESAKQAAPDTKKWAADLKDAALAAASLIPPIAALPPKIRDVNDVLGAMGVKIRDTATEQEKLLKLYDELGTKTPTLLEEDAAWAKISASVRSLAENDLPAALKLYDQHYSRAIALGATTKQTLDLEAERLQLIVRTAEQSGASATSQIIGLKNIQLQQKALYDSTHLLGNLYSDVLDAVIKGWDQVSGAIIGAIFEGENFGKAMLNIGKQVAMSIMQDLVGTALTALKNAFIGVGKSIQDVTKDWEKLHQAISGAMGAAGGGGLPGGVGGPSGAPGKGGFGGALGMAGDIAGIATAISSIFGNFQMAAVNKSLDVLVNHTLRIFNETENRRKDAWDQHNALSDILLAGFHGVISALGGTSTRLVPPAKMPGIPPGAPEIPEMSSLSAGAYGVSNSTNSSTIGNMQFNVYAATDPRETARQIAETLRTISPKFAAYSS